MVCGLQPPGASSESLAFVVLCNGTQGLELYITALHPQLLQFCISLFSFYYYFINGLPCISSFFQPHYVTEDKPEFLMSLSEPPQCQDYR